MTTVTGTGTDSDCSPDPECSTILISLSMQFIQFVVGLLKNCRIICILLFIVVVAPLKQLLRWLIESSHSFT